MSARECLGAAKCPVGTDCFAEKARAEAGRADVVVTNHALLAIDALEARAVLPEHDVVVVDEAHELVDRVTGVATVELAAGAVGPRPGAAGGSWIRRSRTGSSRRARASRWCWTTPPLGRWDVLAPSAAGVLSAVRDAATSCKQALGADRREDPRRRRSQGRPSCAGRDRRHRTD